MNAEKTAYNARNGPSDLTSEIRKRVSFPLKEIICFDSVGSTNTILKELAEKGAPEGTLVIANEQTDGKGRNGKSFYSPRGTGLYMSLLLRPSLSADKSKLITTCAAVAVCRAIEFVCGCVAGIKWVNDVYVRGKKVCGILTEGAVDPLSGTLSYAVLGIGINIFEPNDGFGPVKEIAGALFSKENSMPQVKSALTARITDCFFKMYGSLSTTDHIDEYVERSIITGKKVSVVRNGSIKQAEAIGINEDLTLLVRFDDGSTENLASGDVSIIL